MSFLNHIADMAGGLFGRVTGTKQSNELAQSQFNSQMDESLQRRVQDGLKAGINPLAAIGASVNYSPTIHSGGSNGTDPTSLFSMFGSAAKGLKNMLLNKQEDDIAYDKEAKQLDLESRRLENRILRNRVKESSLNLSKGAGIEEPAPTMQGEELLFKPVYDIQGRPRLVINQNALEADSDNPGYMSSILNAIGNAMHNNQITPDGRVTSPQLQMMIDDFYYQTTGHHIKNLESLYISPTEAGIAAAELFGQVTGGLKKGFN